MSQLHKLIDAFRARTDLSVADHADAWLITIPKRSGEICRVTVPRERFEWFADVQRGGKEVWSDWMEHYGSPPPELDAEMAADIADFVERATTGDLELPLEISRIAAASVPPPVPIVRRMNRHWKTVLGAAVAFVCVNLVRRHFGTAASVVALGGLALAWWLLYIYVEKRLDGLYEKFERLNHEQKEQALGEFEPKFGKTLKRESQKKRIAKRSPQSPSHERRGSPNRHR